MKMRKVIKSNAKLIFTFIVILSIAGTALYRAVSTRFTIECYPDSGHDYVVLLHGIGGFSYSMTPLAKELHKQGYTVINVNYPSTLYDIPTIAETFLDSVITTRCIDPERKIHFVTHSMGGIVTRYYLKNHIEELNLGRVVMLSPPNNGSEIVDAFKSNVTMESIFGPAFNQLGTDSSGIVHSLGLVEYEVGIITGNKAFNIPGAMIIPGDDDGIVAVKSARVEGMIDFEVIEVSHTFIMLNKKIIKDVACFLKKGNFQT